MSSIMHFIVLLLQIFWIGWSAIIFGLWAYAILYGMWMFKWYILAILLVVGVALRMIGVA